MLEGYAFVLPFILGIVFFFAFPLYVSLKLSFGDLTKIVGFHIQWSGLDNYRKAFFEDIQFVPLFIDILKRTLLNAPLIIVFSLLLAMLINNKIKFRGFFRVAFFIPFLLGTGDVMLQLLSLGVDRQLISLSEGGLVPRELLMYFGQQAVSAIDTLFGMIVLVLWSSGVQILLFLSGLQNISVSLYESAKIDGATEWEMFWKITLPMISPILLLVIIYTIVDSFTSVANPILHYIKVLAFTTLQFEYAAALGWLYFGFIIIVVLLVMWILGKSISRLGVDKAGDRS